jgi:hypothetical protein
MAYFHATNEYSGMQGFGCGPSSQCGACGQKRAALSEYYFEDDETDRRRLKGIGYAGFGEAITPGPIVRTFKVVVKSFIAPIRFGAGSPYCGGLVNPSADVRLRALAVATDLAFSENPLSDAMDKRYRLYSSRSFVVTCSNGRIVTVVPTPVITDAGTECIPRTSACLQPPPLIVSGVTAGTTSPSTFEFSWTAKGRPHLAAEPAFQAVCPRTSVYIWHRIHGRIQCNGSDARLDITGLTGSRFPSHRVFVNGVIRAPGVAQGPLSNLWIPSSMSDPTLVR